MYDSVYKIYARSRISPKDILDLFLSMGLIMSVYDSGKRFSILHSQKEIIK